MYGNFLQRPRAAAAVAFFFLTIAPVPAAAQPPQEPQPPHDMQHMHAANEPGTAMPPAREGSGTSWLPDESPMYAVHRQAGPWMLMAHASAFLQYLHESGSRGTDQA